MHVSIGLCPVADYHPGAAQAFLIEADWPKRLPHSTLAADHWMRGVAPTEGLLNWLKVGKDRWDTFCEVYWSDLAANPHRWMLLLNAAQQGDIVLLHEGGHADAAKALAEFLRRQLDDEAPRWHSPVCYQADFDGRGKV